MMWSSHNFSIHAFLIACTLPPKLLWFKSRLAFMLSNPMHKFLPLIFCFILVLQHLRISRTLFFLTLCLSLYLLHYSFPTFFPPLDLICLGLHSFLHLHPKRWGNTGLHHQPLLFSIYLVFSSVLPIHI